MSSAIRSPRPRRSLPRWTRCIEEVVAAVEQLPDAQRAVNLLVAIEGLSYREAAEALDVPIGTVMSRLARARLTIGRHFNVQPSNVETLQGALL